MLDARIASYKNKIIQNSYFKNKVRLEEQTESSERGSVSTRKTDRLHDLRLFSSNGCAWLSLFATMMFRNLKRDGMKLYHLWPRSHLMFLGKFAQIKNTWVWETQDRIGIVRHGDSSEDIAAQLSEVENDGEEEYGSETSITKFDARNERIETGAVVTSRRWLSGNGKHKGSVREETNAVSSTTVMSVQNQHQKPLHLLSHQHKEAVVRREKGSSEVRVNLGSPIDSRAKTPVLTVRIGL